MRRNKTCSIVPPLQVISASPSVPYNCAGAVGWAFDYIIKQGVAKETSYPYTAVQSGCNDSIDLQTFITVLTLGITCWSQSEIPIADGQIKQIKAAACVSIWSSRAR